MPPFLSYTGGVITGEELAQARNRSGLTQAELGSLAGVTGRTIRDWESNGVPRHKEARVLDIERLWGTVEEFPSPLADFSDMALLSELGRRLAAYAERPHGNEVRLPNIQESGSEGHDSATAPVNAPNPNAESGTNSATPAPAGAPEGSHKIGHPIVRGRGS